MCNLGVGSNRTEDALKNLGGGLLGRLRRVSERPKVSALDRVGQEGSSSIHAKLYCSVLYAMFSGKFLGFAV